MAPKKILTIEQLRRQALRAALLPPATLGRAVAALGFVQADPIRAPARAQDLILRHRVAGYRAGELERRFARLGLEEDFLYAYGFMPKPVSRLLHPRPDPESPDGLHRPSGLAAEVLAFVREQGATHPLDLEAQFGRERAVNGWGGFSKATTRALHGLHYHGLLRVARRKDGIRIYEAAPAMPEPLPAEARTRALVMLVARILAPVPEAGLRATFSLLARGAPGLRGLRETMQALVASGELASGEVDGERYLWPAELKMPRNGEAPREVRFLAPFDPLVWDRRRFEHLWGWAYRFEAYTPPAKRRMGYYAMPLLWGDEVIGWVNVGAGEATGPEESSTGPLQVEAGFVGARSRERAFRDAFDAEVARMEAFLAREP
jgi:uncharacterized protein YcaQ